MIPVSRIEKVAAHRARVNEVKGIFSFVKQADEIDYEKRRARLKMLLLALTGTYVGSMTGANVAALNGGKVGKGALIGAGVGTALGAGLGAVSNSANRWAGIDPLVRTVAIAKS